MSPSVFPSFIKWMWELKKENLIIPNSHGRETTSISLDRWMAKENVVYAYNGIVFGL